MMIDITQLLQAVIAFATIMITGYLIPYIKAKAKEAKATAVTAEAAAEEAAEKLSNIAAWVNIAVTAAEQVYNSGQGNVKKQYALEWLAKKGIALDDETIFAQVELLIENAVYQLKNA